MWYYRICVVGAGISIPIGGGVSIPGADARIIVGSRVGTALAAQYTGRALSGMAGVGVGMSDWIESPFSGQVFRRLDGKRFRVKLYGASATTNIIDTEAWVYTTDQRPVQVLRRRGIGWSGPLLSTVDVTVELRRGLGGHGRTCGVFGRPSERW